MYDNHQKQNGFFYCNFHFNIITDNLLFPIFLLFSKIQTIIYGLFYFGNFNSSYLLYVSVCCRAFKFLSSNHFIRPCQIDGNHCDLYDFIGKFNLDLRYAIVNFTWNFRFIQIYL